MNGGTKTGVKITNGFEGCSATGGVPDSPTDRRRRRRRRKKKKEEEEAEKLLKCLPCLVKVTS
jgi:hypothetical protein